MCLIKGRPVYTLPVSGVACLLKDVPGSLHSYACIHIVYVVFYSPFYYTLCGRVEESESYFVT